MSEWPRQPLVELATVTMGQSPDAAAVNDAEAGLPFLQGCAEFGERIPTPRLHCSPPLRVAKAGSTLISVRAPVGTTNRADQDYCIGRGLGAVLAKSGVADDVFLLHAIEANLEFLHRRSQGSTFLAISSKDLYSLPVPAPGLPTQRRIAEILSTLDEAIEQTEALIAKMQQVKAGLMHDLFTRGVTPDGRLRPTREQAPELYKESPLGWIPKEWEVDCFGSRVSIVDPNPSHRYPEPAFTGIPICSTENFSGEDDYDLDNSKLMPESIFTLQSSRCGFSPLDIIFARKGRIGLARRYGLEKKVFSHTVVVFKPASDLVSYEWLLWLSRSQWLFGGIERKMNSNSGVPTLGISFIQDLTVPFPPPEEQALISKGLDDIAHLISAESENASKQRKKKYGLMHDLLGGVVAVS